MIGFICFFATVCKSLIRVLDLPEFFNSGDNIYTKIITFLFFSYTGEATIEGNACQEERGQGRLLPGKAGDEEGTDRGCTT